MSELVILVNEHDEETGYLDKTEAHVKGVLHRAFSVLLFNSKGEMLLQQRAAGKYHSAGLWTNTCCSHPKPGESVQQAARRRLLEEMGIDLQPEFSYKFVYRAELDNDLIEHELDHVYTGIYNEDPIVNKGEVADWKYMSWDAVKQDVLKNPGRYTPWFRLILARPECKPALPVL